MRFYLNPNSLTMAGGDILDIFTGRNASSDVMRIQMQKNGSNYQIRARLLNDASAWTDTSWYDVPNSWSAVEIHYQAFANSGSLTLWLDDVQKQSLTFIDNDTRTLTDVRLGAQGVETGTRGTVYFDDFESRRFSYIGTLTDPGVNDPAATNPAGWTASTYTYSTTIPHAVTSIAIESGGTNTYSYDANGNMTCRIENGVAYSHTYNPENRASSIAKRNTNCTGTIIESWSFAYDGDGTRVATAHFTGTSGTPDSTTSYYMGGAYEVKDSDVKKYYSIAGMMVAVNDGTAVQYLLTDHLGSTVAVTNASGTLTSQQRYLPFGGARSIPNSPIAGTDFTYTGQRMLDSGMGGIMDYKARFYSPYINRFLQPDSIIPNPANPQSMNRFGYVLNNPIRFNDPTGHVCSDPESAEADNLVCYGSGTTRVGNTMVRGNHAELGQARNLNKKPEEYILNVHIDMHIGPISGGNIPDFNGSTDRDDRVPYVPGITRYQPNSCAGGAAGFVCGLSLFTSFGLTYGPPNTEPNFFLSFQLHYQGATDSITLGNVQMSNLYQGNAVFSAMKINNQVIYQKTDSCIPQGGYYPLDNRPYTFLGDKPLELNVAIITTQQLPGGPVYVAHQTTTMLPSLPEMRCQCSLPYVPYLP